MAKVNKNISKSNLRIPPQSIESEQAVLGSIMLRKDAMHEVEDMVSPDSFYVEKHSRIFQAKLDLFELLHCEPNDKDHEHQKLQLQRQPGQQWVNKK